MPLRHFHRVVSFVVLVAFAICTSCAHTTQILTEPEGARVTVNGAPAGDTPTIYSSRSGFPRTYYVKIQKEGYENVELTLDSTYQADLSLLLLIPGIIPYFFSARLEKQYTYPLVAKEGKPAGS